MWRTLVREGFFFTSGKRALRAASQSKTEWTDRALNGDLAGLSRLEMAGLGGSLRLGKVAGPVGGADMGIDVLAKGLGGIIGAVAGGEGFLVVSPSDESECSSLHEHSEGTLVAVSGTDTDSGVVSPEWTASGEFREMALDKKSV